jgi:phosphoribosyl-dephospho-CoA transferase
MDTKLFLTAANKLTKETITLFKTFRDRPFNVFKRDLNLKLTELLQGWSDQDTWSLDYSLAKTILPRLKRFKEITLGIPGHIETKEEWDAILDKMIAAFEFYASEEHWSAYPSEWEKHKEGLKLFAENYSALWW